jgi:hypothetical protein
LSDQEGIVQQQAAHAIGDDRPNYRLGSADACPDCGNTQWHVGRQSAECACCGTALPLADPALRQPPSVRSFAIVQ